MNSINLLGKIDQPTIDLFRLVNQIIVALDMQYLVVGATARDIVYHYRFNTPVKRATTDTDFGIQVQSWNEFSSLSQMLVREGFKSTNSPQQFTCPNNTKLDIVPFGSIQDDKANIQWPPNGDVEMNVLGFEEALNYAFQVKIDSNPTVHIPVASPQGLVLLKIIAWSDRRPDMRARDALDIAYLLEYYEKDRDVFTRIYEEKIAERYGYDVTLGCAHVLGIDAGSIAIEPTKKRIISILEQNLKQEENSLLVEEMCTNIDTEFEKNLAKLNAFSNGFSA